MFSQQQELSSKVFAHLCDVVDDNEGYYDEKIHQISKLIILEGNSTANFPQRNTTGVDIISVRYSISKLVFINELMYDF